MVVIAAELSHCSGRF